ncbi:MAG: hypothetical protein ACT4PP_14585 [Sporichthyaceae bacterium]
MRIDVDAQGACRSEAVGNCYSALGFPTISRPYSIAESETSNVFTPLSEVRQGGKSACRTRQRSTLGLIGAAAVTAILMPSAVAGTGAAGTFVDKGSITIPTARSLYSAGEILPPGVVPAVQYPAAIEVSGLPGSITDVDVTVKGLTHTYPSDIHLLLVGPAGQSVLLMAHCGGMMPVSDRRFTFDDEADAELPHQDYLNSGAVRPADPNSGGRGACLGSPVSAPAPAPAPGSGYGSDLSVFDATDPNGIWDMFVFDDFSDLDGGEIAAGWSLRIRTAP